MKKLFFILALTSFSAWSKPLFLISYYDPFGKAVFNNSERIAHALEKSLNKESSPVRVKLCGLETKFDVSYGQLEKCLRDLDERPAMVLGLGETGCNLKIEMVGRNLDNTLPKQGDNAKVERRHAVIIPEADPAIGFTYPLEDMYCAIPQQERRFVLVSNDAGSFVCNNTAFQLSYHYPEIPSGFMHVPTNSCKKIEQINIQVIRHLELMLTSLANKEIVSKRLPVTKAEVQEQREYWADKDECRSSFYQFARGLKK